MNEDRNEAMRKLGIEAAKAGESLRKVFLAIKKLQKCPPPFKYHR